MSTPEPRHETGPIGVVAGLSAERRCLAAADRGGHVQVRLSGADAERAAGAARSLAEQGARLLLSFGLAGGLDPRFGPGTVIVADRVYAWRAPFVPAHDNTGQRKLSDLFSLRRPKPLAADELGRLPVSAEAEYETDARLRQGLLEHAGRRAVAAPVVGVDRPVMSVAEKQGLFVQTRAAAADMESHMVAAVAREAAIPFAVLRVVADPSNRTVPRAALAGVRPDGSTAPLAVLGALSMRPWEVVDLLSLAADTWIALGALRRVARRGAPFLLGFL